MGKIKGIEITDLVVGTGAEAEKDSCVAANVRMFLRRGDEVGYRPDIGSRRIMDLGKRECITGLRYGIPGMRVGGIRQILIAPHLAYGETGIPGTIPPNALLRCEIELLEIRAHSSFLPQDHLPGRLLIVYRSDKAGEKYSGWRFFIHENGNASLHFVRKRPGTGRESFQFLQIPFALDPRTSAKLVDQAQQMLSEAPSACLPWGPASISQTGSTVTDRRTGKSCLCIEVADQGQRGSLYAVPEDNEEFLNSDFYKTISVLVEPRLKTPPVPES
jgi:hypothetical protein